MEQEEISDNMSDDNNDAVEGEIYFENSLTNLIRNEITN